MDTTGCSIQHITHLLDDILIIALWCGAYIIVMYEMPASSISTTKPHSVQYGILKKEKRAKLFIMNSDEETSISAEEICQRNTKH